MLKFFLQSYVVQFLQSMHPGSIFSPPISLFISALLALLSFLFL